MRHFILSGGGDPDQSKVVDEFFVSLLSRKKILYLPQAVAPHYWDYEKTYEWIKNHDVFDNLEITMWKDEELQNKSFSDLDEFDAIYIMGGNTFTLLDKLSKYNFINILYQFLDSGRLLFGLSAGSILMGKSILVAQIGPDKQADTNDVGLTDFQGLDLLKGKTAYTHYGPAEDKQLFEYSKKYNAEIIGIPEESGIYVEGDKVTVLGTKSVVIIKDEQKVQYNLGINFSL